ncbi:MAG TPA: sulfurtransferase-like selenium metabolism protein YedF [Chloroflexota bacterium]|nr:sulfurtransferase-like selenium metabolism protein YedF [Chloroflexota bacterium]
MEARMDGRTVLVLDAATLGRGDDELGAQLIVNFLRTMAFRDEVPETVVCYNGGVKLAEQGSPAVPMLEALSQKGAEILLCGTCVNYYQLGERLALGRVSNMQEIVEVISTAAKAIYV